LITLTFALLVDLSAVHTRPDFAACLDRIHKRTGMSLSELEKEGKALILRNSRFRELKRSTVSDALSGKRPVKKDLLDSLLAAWKVPQAECVRVIDAWRRVNSASGQGPANAGRFDEASPRELGIHAAIPANDSASDLPSYVPRKFDEQLQNIISRGAVHGCFVVLVGASSTGKTRSLYEAVYNVVPDWWLVQPTTTQAIFDLLETPTGKTVLWLDELHRYLGTVPPLTKADVRTLVRAGTIVVGTLWPDEYVERKTLRRTDGNDIHSDDRMLLDFAEVISVPDTLTEEERQRATELAGVDSRIRAALKVSDAGFTQVLAAGPDMVHWWEQAPGPYAKAIITAAADAHRLGVHSPLSGELLTAAMAGYLTPRQQVRPPESWLESALQHATAQLHGAVTALAPVVGPRAGTLGGYVVADYLAQHIRRIRRIECPPASLWAALLTHVRNPDDLRRLAAAATTRMRYGYAELALRRLLDFNDSIAGELAALLVAQDRCGEALALVDQRLSTAPNDRQHHAQRKKIVELQGRAELLRRQAAGHPQARARLEELLADGGMADDLRTRAAAGDRTAADQLAEILADRGCLDELRERADAGHQFAAERVADFLVAQGRIAELRQRADAGDRAAGFRLTHLTAATGAADQEGIAEAGPPADLGWSSPGQPDVIELRVAADAGNEEAASQLAALLFDARDQDALLAEVNAGTYRAADRYLALLTAEQSLEPSLIAQIRAFGLDAGGSVRGHEEPR
jgi:hypothetical protein